MSIFLNKMDSIYTYTNNYRKINISEINHLNYTRSEILSKWKNELDKQCIYSERYDYYSNKYIEKVIQFKDFLEKNNCWIIYYDGIYCVLNDLACGVIDMRLFSEFSQLLYNITYDANKSFVLSDQLIDIFLSDPIPNLKLTRESLPGNYYGAINNLKVKFLENKLENLKTINEVILNKLDTLTKTVNYVLEYDKKYS